MAILKGRLPAALLAAALLYGSLARAQDNGFRESEVKAAVVFNFAKFVEWPPEVFASSAAPIVICVLGADPFGTVLDQAVAGETAGGRPIVVKRSAHVEDLRPCHILYISSSEKARLPGILGALKDAKVLTVGELDRFTKLGGIILLRVKEGKVRFDINKAAADRSGLKISSHLLKLAATILTDES